MKVISFSVYGDLNKYKYGCLRNLKSAKKFFPDWVCRFYVCQKFPILLEKEIKNLGGQVFRETCLNDDSGMFWRFYPGVDQSVDCFISRDVDSDLSERDAFVVNEWMKSSYKYHVIRDHPSQKWKIMGGLWGAKGEIKDFLIKIKKFIKNNNPIKYNSDLIFLSQFYNTLSKEDVLVHSDFIKYEGENLFKINSKEKDLCYGWVNLYPLMI